MDKKPSYLWVFAVGALFLILQVLIFLFRFSSINTDATLMDYLFFFIGGAIIGVGLVYFLRRSENNEVFRATVIGFVIGIPFSLFGMLMGGLIGPIGSIVLGMSPAVFITGVGYFLGRAFSKK